MCRPATTTKNVEIKFKMYVCMRASLRACMYVCVCMFGGPFRTRSQNDAFLDSQIGSLPILVRPFDLSFVCYASKLGLRMRVGRNL